MSDLATRLLAAIEETEQIAREAAGEKWLLPCGPSWAVLPLRVAPYHYGWDHRVAGGWDSSVVDEAHETVAAHIALHDPETVLRRCAADRKNVELHTPKQAEVYAPWLREATQPDFGCPTCHYDYDCGEILRLGVCATLRNIAEGYGIIEEDREGD